MAGAGAVYLSDALRRRTSYRGLRCLSSSEGQGDVTFSLELPREEEPPPPLDACFLCRMPLRASSDVFMYRGNTPFCSADCRQEQMELDEAREREISFRRKRHQQQRGVSLKQALSSAQQALYAHASDAVVAS